jgi:hypothetical protein
MAKKSAKKSSKGSSKGGTKQFDLDRFIKRSSGSFKEAAKRAAEDKGGFAEYDDGKYGARLLSLGVGQAQSSGRVQATFEWKFLNGEYKGKTYRSYRGLVTADDHFYFMKDLQRLGYDLDEFDPADLPDLIKQVKKDQGEFKIQLKTKGDFQNVYILDVYEKDEDEDDDEEEEDDEPKSKKKSKKKDDEDEEEEDEDDEDSDDEDEEEEEEEKPKKGKGKKSKKSEEEDEDEEDDDEDDEDEDEEDEDEDEPKKKGKSKSKAKKSKKDEDDEDDDDEEEDEDEDAEEDGDDVAVTVGSIIKTKIKGKTMKVEVTEIFEDDREVKVKTDAGKTVRISVEDILEVVDMPKRGKKSKK